MQTIAQQLIQSATNDGVSFGIGANGRLVLIGDNDKILRWFELLREHELTIVHELRRAPCQPSRKDERASHRADLKKIRVAAMQRTRAEAARWLVCHGVLRAHTLTTKEMCASLSTFTGPVKLTGGKNSRLRQLLDIVTGQLSSSAPPIPQDITVIPPGANPPRYVRKAQSSDDFYRSPEWRHLRHKVLIASSGRCECCGASPRNSGIVLHVDHIKPRSRFPHLELEISNLQVLCEACNMGKGNTDATDWRKCD